MKLKIAIHHYFIAYFFLLMWLYHYKIKHHYYWGYISHLQDMSFDFLWSRFFIASGIFFINLLVLIKLKRTRFIFVVLSIFFALLTIPSLIAFTSGEIYPIKLLVYHQVFFFLLYLFSKIQMNFNDVPIVNKTQALYLLLAITTIGVIPYLIVYGPYIDLKNLFLEDVYKTRTLMGKLSNPYFGYTYSVFTKIIIPLIIVFALELKKSIWVVVGVLYLILFYLFGAHKTVYVGLFVVLVFYRFTFEKAVKYIAKYGSLAIIVCLIFALAGNDYPWVLSFRRVHFLPTLLDISYLDFFNGKQLYWSESIFKAFLDYPYDARSTNIIGEAYFKRLDMSANNGFVSEGYMNFGTWGVLINILIVSSFFMVLNNLKIPAKYFGLFILTMFSFLSSPVFTVLLTHGGFALIIVSIFLLNDKKA